MHTNTWENNKFIFYKMVQDQIYHDCEMEDPVLNQAGL